MPDLTEQDVMYRDCVKSGTHRPGRREAEPRLWHGVYVRMPICATCGVPIPPRQHATKKVVRNRQEEDE